MHWERTYMKVMILAAGLGTRLHPLTTTCPKPLAPLMLQPLLGHLLTQLQQYGVREVVINLHHHAEQLRQWIGDGRQWGFERVHLSYEPEILGTAGAIKKAEALLRDAPFCLINADVLTDIDLAAMWRWHQQRQAVVTMALRPDPEALRYGPVVMDDKQWVRHINRQPASISHVTGEMLMFTGIQVVSPQIFTRIPPHQFVSTTSDVYPQLIAEGAAVCGYRHDGYWIDMGVPTRYRQAHWDCLNGIYRGVLASPPEGTRLIRRLEDAPAAWAHATIEPPVAVGPNVDLAPKARLGPYAVIGAGCRLEAGASVRESVLWDGVQIGAGARVERCILGAGAVAPAHQQLIDVAQSAVANAGG